MPSITPTKADLKLIREELNISEKHDLALPNGFEPSNFNKNSTSWKFPYYLNFICQKHGIKNFSDLVEGIVNYKRLLEENAKLIDKLDKIHKESEYDKK